MAIDQLRPARWKFTAEDDIAAYGDRWWMFDAPALIRLKARELMKIEETIGMPIVTMLRKVREETTVGTFAALWVSMHMAGHEVAWDEFDPTVFLTVWEAVPDEAPLDSGADPETDESSSTEPPTESATS